MGCQFSTRTKTIFFLPFRLLRNWPWHDLFLILGAAKVGIFWGEQNVEFFLFHTHEVRKTWESFFDYLSWFLDTPPKFNSSPLKSYLPDRKVVFQPPFSGSMLNFGGVFLVGSYNVTIMYCNHQRMKKKKNKYTFIHIHGSAESDKEARKPMRFLSDQQYVRFDNSTQSEVLLFSHKKRKIRDCCLNKWLSSKPWGLSFLLLKGLNYSGDQLEDCVAMDFLRKNAPTVTHMIIFIFELVIWTI